MAIAMLATDGADISIFAALLQGGTHLQHFMRRKKRVGYVWRRLALAECQR